MESDKKKWIGILEHLLIMSSRISNFYNRFRNYLTEPSSKNLFLKQASKQAQLVYDLRLQIKAMGGNIPSLGNFPHKVGPTPILAVSGENISRLSTKILEHLSSYRREYHSALRVINDGRCREILIRHRAILESNIKEIKRLLADPGQLPHKEQLQMK